MNVDVVDCGSARCGDLCTALEDVGAGARRVPLAEARSATDADAVVISGGPLLFTDDPALVDRFAFIDDLAVPALGICLGHQAIGLRHGARIHRGPDRRGTEVIELRGRHPLFAGLPRRFPVTADHCEGIGAPPAFAVLASSGTYFVEAMAHRHRPLFGVQFHPEASGDAGQRVLANFIQIVRARAPHPTLGGSNDMERESGTGARDNA